MCHSLFTIRYTVLLSPSSSVSSYFVSCSKDRTAKFWCMDRVYPLRNMLGHMQDVDVSIHLIHELILWTGLTPSFYSYLCE